MRSYKAWFVLVSLLSALIFAGCDFYGKAEIDTMLEIQPVYFLTKLTDVYDWPTNGSVQKIVFGESGTVLENEGSAFNAETSSFRAPESGIYDFSGHAHYTSIAAGNLVYIFLKVGGRNYYGDWRYAGGTAEGLNVNVTLTLEAGNTVELWGFISSSTPPGKVYGNSTLYLFTYFSGVRIR